MADEEATKKTVIIKSHSVHTPERQNLSKHKIANNKIHSWWKVLITSLFFALKSTPQEAVKANAIASN